MKKIINISDKLNSERPRIVINDKEYEVNDGMSTVLKFEEILTNSPNNAESMMQAIKLTMGENIVEELKLKEWSVSNFTVLTIAILAAMQGVEYDEAEARFPK